MFDFGFTELILIAVVALIVVGPERLPKVARTAGHLLGRLQRYVSDVKSDISREMQLEDLKKLQQQVEQQARDLESSMRGQVRDLESDLGKTASQVSLDLSLDDRKSTAETAIGQSAALASATPVHEAPASEVRHTPVDSALTLSGAADGSEASGEVGAAGREGAPAADAMPQRELNRAAANRTSAEKS